MVALLQAGGGMPPCWSTLGGAVALAAGVRSCLEVGEGLRRDSRARAYAIGYGHPNMLPGC